MARWGCALACYTPSATARERKGSARNCACLKQEAGVLLGAHTHRQKPTIVLWFIALCVDLILRALAHSLSLDITHPPEEKDYLTRNAPLRITSRSAQTASGGGGAAAYHVVILLWIVVFCARGRTQRQCVLHDCNRESIQKVRVHS